VGQDQRKRIGVRRSDVDEVDPKPIYLGAELRQSVKAGLGGPPVVNLGPVVAKFLHVSERNSLRPVLDGFALRPARVLEALTKIIEVVLGNLDAKLCDLVFLRCSPP
jgi:hypothetical protein